MSSVNGVKFGETFNMAIPSEAGLIDGTCRGLTAPT